MIHYEFPVINNISDLLPAIEGRDEFIVAEKEGYTVVNYAVAFEDTFPPVNVAGGSAKMREERSLHNRLRRECRGIIFDSVTGNIIRRPYHKFFNVNERDETQYNKIDLGNSNRILEKLDGSMIVPFVVAGEIIWGTKMGATDVAKPVEEFVASNPIFRSFASWMIADGYSPIFEWCSRKQRIVLDYAEDQLILTAVRNIRDGSYVPYETLCEWIADFPGIRIARAFDPQSDMKEFLEYVHDLQDVEGFVVRFDSGHMVKLKCHWYIQLHRAKEAILQDRNIVEMIINENIDDVKAHLPEEDRVRLANFEYEIVQAISMMTAVVHNRTRHFVEHLKIDRKRFALEFADKEKPFVKALIFSLWDDNSPERARELVLNTIANQLSKTAKYEAIRDAWFMGAKFND